jgi:hypothetical protein
MKNFSKSGEFNLKKTQILYENLHNHENNTTSYRFLLIFYTFFKLNLLIYSSFSYIFPDFSQIIQKPGVEKLFRLINFPCGGNLHVICL